ncbi:hypothetical protein GN958_ATG12108 [Phytophthora infestans]|uniref:Uncharacterized protein n=1 Tax=Phytophthora infestans TaxID=4787 RepID=A0A8S9UIE9_PHYIN|nr:hypothetical protein GN958_ATG12108 [Phytophthora infestans]
MMIEAAFSAQMTRMTSTSWFRGTGGVPSSPAAHTSIGTPLFGSSDEDGSDDEVAIDEGEVVIVEDDNGDFENEDGASCCIL